MNIFRPFHTLRVSIAILFVLGLILLYGRADGSQSGDPEFFHRDLGGAPIPLAIDDSQIAVQLKSQVRSHVPPSTINAPDFVARITKLGYHASDFRGYRVNG